MGAHSLRLARPRFRFVYWLLCRLACHLGAQVGLVEATIMMLLMLVQCQVALIQILYNLLFAVHRLIVLGRFLRLPSRLTHTVEEAFL